MLSWIEPALVVLGGGFLSLKLLAIWSHKRCAARGLIAGKLAPNNPSPNSVCSEAEGANIAPIAVSDPESWKSLKDAVESLSGRFITTETHYLHAVFRTPLLGFEDDLEARFDSENNLIHLRSSSRVGHSDMGANLKRVEALRRLVE